MSMISIENLTFSYPSNYDNIFENVSIKLDTEWKLGIIGRNGRGKTSLLKLLLGEYEYSGKISSPVRFEYFPYDVKDKTQITEYVLQEICPKAQRWELIRELSYLKIESDVLWTPFDNLSGGQQTKVLLAALFLRENSFLLIDEPTNHLDSAARRQVAEYLKKKKSFILVSHDRYLLDECVDHILSFNRADIQVQVGNYSSWIDNFEKEQNYELNKQEILKKEIKRMKASARQTSSWSDKIEASKVGACDKGYIGHKSAKMMKRAKNIEDRREKAIEEKSMLLKNRESAETLKINSLVYHNERYAAFSDVFVFYGKKCVCKPITFEVLRGERIFINGENGSGKSSLLKLLVKEPIEHSGTVTLASGLIISYVPQDTAFLNGTLTEFAEMNNIDESLFKTILRKMDFERTQFEKDMRDFSEGQKKKVLIARSLCQLAHLYVWDEPLNYIDIYSRMQIEQLIIQFNPTMLLVEHDVTFAERIATKTIFI